MPLGCWSDFELSRMRVVSTQLAPITTTLPSTVVLLAGLAVEVLHALRQAVVVHEHARDDGVRADLELAGLQGARAAGGRPSRRTTPCRSRRRSCRSSGRRGKPLQSACVLLARRPATIGMSSASHAFCEQPLAAAQRRRRHEELAARQRVRVVVAAADADQLIDLVVVRRDVPVVDRPGDLPAVASPAALKSSSRVAQADAAPDVGLAAVAPDADQLERPVLGRQVRLFLRVEEELRRLLAARPALARLPRADVRPELRCDRTSRRRRAAAR